MFLDNVGYYQNQVKRIGDTPSGMSTFTMALIRGSIWKYDGYAPQVLQGLRQEEVAEGYVAGKCLAKMAGNPYGMFSKALSSSLSHTAMTSSMMLVHRFLGMRMPVPAASISSRDGLPA